MFEELVKILEKNNDIAYFDADYIATYGEMPTMMGAGGHRQPVVYLCDLERAMKQLKTNELNDSFKAIKTTDSEAKIDFCYPIAQSIKDFLEGAIEGEREFLKTVDNLEVRVAHEYVLRTFIALHKTIEMSSLKAQDTLLRMINN